AAAGELGRAGRQRHAAFHQRLGADGPDGARGHQQIKQRADAQAADQADGHVALGIFGFLGGGGNGVETDIGEEDRGGGAEHAGGAGGREGGEILRVQHRQGEGDEGGEGGDLDHHQHGVDAGAFGGADDQQPGDGGGNQDGGNVDPAAGGQRRLDVGRRRGAEQQFHLGHQRVGVADGGGEVIARSVQQAHRMVGPAPRHGVGADGIFQDQGP